MNKLPMAAVLGLAGALAIGAGPASAGPAGTNPTLRTAVPLTITSVRHRVNAATQESDAEHRQRCWVVTDKYRNFGYFKC